MQNVKSSERLEIYLKQVRKNLRGMDDAEVSEVIQELRSHVLDSADGDFSDANVDRALALLGDPREVARINSTRHVAAGAGNQSSPLVLLRTIFRLATLSVRGVVVLAISLLGYGFAACWLLTAIAKPFFPNRVGLWSVADPTDDFSYSLGRRAVDLSGHDLLGWWIIPVGICIGLGVTFLTYRYHQRAIRSIAHGNTA